MIEIRVCINREIRRRLLNLIVFDWDGWHAFKVTGISHAHNHALHVVFSPHVFFLPTKMTYTVISLKDLFNKDLNARIINLIM